MGKKNLDDDNEASVLAKISGLPYRVDVSPELKNLLKPNEFLKGLGIRYMKRIKIILDSLKGNLVPVIPGQKEAVPNDGVIIPLAVAKGPFIKEEIISIRAVLKDDGGKPYVTLTVAHDTE